jgi:hypothetical protein
MKETPPMRPILTHALLGYAVLLSTVVAFNALGGSKQTSFDTINVHRVNLRDADGTLRMVIADKAEFPGIIVKGKEYPHISRKDVAGMIFFNDEGTENGGLIFSGEKKDGVVSSSGHLSFDQYLQDQVVTLQQTEDGGDRQAGLTIDDRPDQPIDFAAWSHVESMPPGPAQDAEVKRMREAPEAIHNQQRLFVGKADNNSMISLRDELGRKRLVLTVTASGDASIQFLDEAGKVVKTVTPQP